MARGEELLAAVISYIDGFGIDFSVTRQQDKGIFPLYLSPFSLLLSLVGAIQHRSFVERYEKQ